jgi:hypothetical protein
VKVRTVYQLKVTLRDIKPPVWRRFQLWDDTPLSQLHRAIQALFNWEDYHLHDFVINRIVYSVPSPEDRDFDRKVVDEKAVPLNRLIHQVGETFLYRYDFGDDWHHNILLEAIMLPEANTAYPRCIAGARNGPPEDSGGAWGYTEYLEALADPAHDRHSELLEWRGPFDPEAFSLTGLDAALKRVLVRRIPNRKSAKTRERVASNSVHALELTDRELELILHDSFAPAALTRRMQVVPPPGEIVVVYYTLAELDALAACVGSEALHTARTIKKQWKVLLAKIARILDANPEGE